MIKENFRIGKKCKNAVVIHNKLKELKEFKETRPIAIHNKLKEFKETRAIR